MYWNDSEGEAENEPRVLTRRERERLRATQELIKIDNRANAEQSVGGRLKQFINKIDPVPEPRQHGPPVSIRMRPVPKTEAELLAAAKNCRLFGPNQQSVLQKPRGKLIGSIYQSWKAGRPIGHVFLFLLGDSGVGKSSTVNHLIHETVAETSNCKSETRSTTEHILITEDPNLAAKNVSLSIVDPPGFKDVEGPEQDARNLRSIEKFFSHHPSLMGKAYPNIILITVPSTDVRFQGKESSFMKCLRAIQRLQLVDRVNPNIVVVITWACALSPKKLKEKMVKIQAVVLDALHIAAPVVCLENVPEDFDLETVGDYTKLPDGTLQPRNLFEAMISVAKRAGDEFAQHCLSTYFDSDMEKVRITKGHSEPARISGLNSKEQRLLDRLKNNSIHAKDDPEVAQKIDAFLITNPLTEEEKNELICVKYDLIDNLRMTKATDLRGYTTGQLCHLLRRPISTRVEAHLGTIFTLRQDSVIPSIVHDLGKGYNLVNDMLLPSCIFKKNLEENSLEKTQFGFMLPQGITLRPLHQSGSYMENFADNEDYAKHRIKLLHVNMKVDTSLLNMKPRPGFNKISEDGEELASFLYEQRLFRLELNGWQDEQKTFICRGFIKDVMDLPKIFDRDHNKGEFEDFFHTWGHFFVVAGYGGGSVDVSVSTNGPDISKRYNFFPEREFLEKIFMELSRGSRSSMVEGDGGLWSNNREDVSSNRMRWSGGDCRYHTDSLAETDPDQWRKWVDSLARDPTLLTTDMVLVPIYQAVGEVSQDKVSACKEALHFILGEQGRSRDLDTLRDLLKKFLVDEDQPSPFGRNWLVEELSRTQMDGREKYTRRDDSRKAKPTRTRCGIQ